MVEWESISWLPPWTTSRSVAIEHFTLPNPRGIGAPYRCARPSLAGWAALGSGLLDAQRALSAVPIARIMEAIDEVARRWGDPDYPLRRSARDAVVRATGFSAEVVERSFDVELRNYRADSLRKTLQRELGTPSILDGFTAQPALGGHSYAVGPKITLLVLTGNVPGLPALSIVRALLVKSAVIAKVASGEPTFAVHFARSLQEVMPELSDALAISYWRRDEAATLEAALGVCDAVIAYGSEEACSAVRARLRNDHRYIEHGHKLSVGILSLDYVRELGLDEVARRVAEDVSTFNQHACIAPQAYLVEDRQGSARELCGAVAVALERYAARCPLGQLDALDAAALQLRRASAAWQAASRPDCAVWRAKGLDWTVQFTSELLPLAGTGNRDLRVVAYTNTADVVNKLAPLGRYLQNVGLGVLGPALPELSRALARIGACRISEPGHMAEPSLMWQHDGEPCLSRLVRFCDVEMHRFVGTQSAYQSAREGC